MNSDFKDLLKVLNAYKVRYLVVGGYMEAERVAEILVANAILALIGTRP